MRQMIAYGLLGGFFVSLLLVPFILPFLRRLKFGQFVRDDGPQSHLKKQGTPTMGGIIFLIGYFLVSLLFLRTNPRILAVLMVTMGFGLIGFLDDYLKIKRKQSEGLKPSQKLILQCAVALSYTAFHLYMGWSTLIRIPFTNGKMMELGILFIPFVLIVILGTVNGANLTDGVDGLLATITLVVCVFLIVAGTLLEPSLSIPAAIMAGGLLCYLLFNVHPAKVFMGDTGSLAIGGFVAAVALGLQMPLYILLFGIIYLAESLSVILQVVSYKTRRKRIFKMAPLHHHFELSGWKETQVVGLFMVVTAIGVTIAYLAI